MGSPVIYSHDEIDPSTIEQTSFGHDDVDHSSVEMPNAQSPEQMVKQNVNELKSSGKAENDALINTLTLGYLPQIKAKAGQILAGEGFGNDQNYIRRRDQASAELSNEAEKYPGETALGKQGGFLAPLAITGGGAAAEEVPAAAQAIVRPGVIQSALKGAGIGAAMGAAQNPGDIEGVVDPLQGGARLHNAEIGAALGGTLGAAASKIPDFANSLEGYAKKKALKAAGAMLKDFRKESANGSVEETGKFILDNGLVKAGDTFSDVADKSEALRDSVGQELGKGYDAAAKIVDRLDPKTKASVDAAGFNPVRDRADILNAVKKDLGYAYKGKQALQGVSEYLDQLAEEHGDQTLNPAITNQIKTSLDKTAINWQRNPLAREPDAEAALKSLRGILNGKVSGQVQKIGEVIGDPEAAAKLADLNSKYGMASKVARISADRANRDAANRAIGLTDTISGGAGAEVGAIIGGPPGAIVGGLAGVAANKIGRSYGPAAVASVANSTSKAISALPELTPMQQANPAIYKALGDIGGAQLNAPIAVAADQPTKGPKKWATDGLQKLMDHTDDPTEKQKLIDQKGALLEDKKTRDLLISASDLNPKTKAMNQVITKVRRQLKEAE